VDVSIIISTFNRAPVLGATLDSIAAMTVPRDLQWEVVVVDNNSTDATRATVETRTASFPTVLRYLFEGRQGKSYAVNTGLTASEATLVAFTDDDVEVDGDWLRAGVEPLLSRADIHYTGGPVFPMWETTPPAWIVAESGELRGPLALVDYGPAAFVFEDRQRIPVGVNMAVRRSAIDRVGGFRADLDRRGASLYGQGQAEFFFRTRAAGLRGLYVPGMRLRHRVPRGRMSATYYRRWWYWKGVARARIEQWHHVSELGLDLAAVARFLDVPRFMWRSAIEDAAAWVTAAVTRNPVRRMEREVALAYFAGYFAGRRGMAAARETACPPEERSVSSPAVEGVAALQSPTQEVRCWRTPY
jgi:glycosyltransferase involved in cell wall biosynthesis